MTSELYRWQAAAGALAGAAVAEAMALDRGAWGPTACRSFELAESMLAGSPVGVEIVPAEAIASAIGLASDPPPLLADPATIVLIDAIRDGLDGRRPIELADPFLAKAAAIAHGDSFSDAVRAAGGDGELALLVGAFAGLGGGLGIVPARLVSGLRAPDGRRRRRYLGSLANRLLGVERPPWYDPRGRRGPKEVLPGIWVSNLFGVRRFVSDHPDGLVLSLCDDEGQAGDHPHHIVFHLDDTPRTDANPQVDVVIDEVLAEVASGRSSGRPVLVHCRHGASRTGLVLRLLLVDELGLSAEDALTEAMCLWRHTSTWNGEWTRLVERRAKK